MPRCGSLGPPSRLFLPGIFSFDSNAGATCSRLHDFRIRSRARSRTHHRFARCSPPSQRRRRDAPTSDELAFAIMSLSSIFYRYAPSVSSLFVWSKERTGCVILPRKNLNASVVIFGLFVTVYRVFQYRSYILFSLFYLEVVYNEFSLTIISNLFWRGSITWITNDYRMFDSSWI